MASDARTDSYPETGDLIDLRTLGLIARRRMRTFLIVTAIVFVLGLVVTMLIPNTYSSTANVLIDRRTMAVADVESVLSGLPSDSASVDTEAQVLQSPALIKQVVQKLRLDRDPEFNTALVPPSIFVEISSGLRKLLASGSGAGPKSPLDRVTNAVLQNLTVSRHGLTYVISVTFESIDAKKAALIANTITGTYLDNQVQQKRDASQQAQTYLGSRLSGLRAEVQRNEGAADALRARAGMPQNEHDATFDESALQDLSRQEIALQSQVAEKRARLQAAQQARANPSALPEVIESNVIRDLKAQRAAAQARNADIVNRYGPLHPETTKSNRELQGIDSEMSDEMGRIVSSLRNDLATTEGQLAVIHSAMGAQRGTSVANARAAVGVDQYEREATASRDLYTDFLKRTKETAEAGDLAKPDASIISVGTVPNKPSFPNPLLFAALSLIFALACGVFAIILVEILDVKISSGSDVERYLGLSRIASIPGVPKSVGEDLPAMIETKPMSSFAEAFRTLGSSLRRSGGADAGADVVMVTSALPHEGKTVVASTLALSLARTGERVLLIETDLRRPHVAEALGIARTSTGIGDAMTGAGQSAATGIIQDAKRNLDLLLVGTGQQDIEMFRGKRFAEFIGRLRPQYRHIVIDTAPVLAISDARQMVGVVDAVLFVTRWRRTSRFAAQAAVAALREAGAPLKGVVLNGVNLKTQSLYSRDDSLAFYGAYRGYYAE